MTHSTPLIATIVAGLGLAFVFGIIGQRLRLPPIAGYLLAGVVIGPFTPGYVANQELATELAEIGVILLMFGVGLHFSLKDLLSVRAIAVPGAIGQMTVATLMGMALAWLMGWSVGAGFVFGLSLSCASTVVLLRALQERRLLETRRGRIGVGWLIVEDLVSVLALVLIPAFSALLGGKAVTSGASFSSGLLGIGEVEGALLDTAVKVGVFVALMLVVGRRLVPSLLHYVAHTGSRELFRLAVLVIALGIAYGSAKLFDVSFALGAFFAGMVLAESPFSAQATKETLPLRDAFAVLFFVSVGMLFDPTVLLTAPFAVLATIFIIIVGKSAAAYGIVRAFGHEKGAAFVIAASLAQIGEFSFILVVLGTSLEILPPLAKNLVVAGALVSILLNPVLFILLERVLARTDPQPVQPQAEAPPRKETEPPDEEPTKLSGHTILVGHGRVGSRVAAALRKAGMPFLVVEDNETLVDELRKDGVEVFRGVAGEAALLERLNLSGARWFVSAIPQALEAATLIEKARAANPSIRTLARAHSDDDAAFLRSVGADIVMIGEEEIARGMIADLIGRQAVLKGQAPVPEPVPGMAAALGPQESI